MKTPYVGITDFMNKTQVERMLEVLARESPKDFKKQMMLVAGKLPRQLMVGVMMSHKTLHGIPTKWTAAFPAKESIRDIFGIHPFAFNTLHYADYDTIDVAESIELATTFGGPNMHAIQLDMIWPDPGLIKNYRDNHPGIQVIIQGNSKAMKAVNNDPLYFACCLKAYGYCVDYVLLDKSMGKGLGMDAMGLLPYARAVAEHVPDMGIAAAGGLGPDTLNLLEPLIAEFPNLSIDAQGKLRPSGNALDPIDWNMASEYLTKALRLFS